MKIYLAGPMRGYVRFNFPAFDAAAALLRAENHEVFNPAERDRATYSPLIETASEMQAAALGFTLREALKADLSWICDHAEGIAMLPGWERSSGALAEWALAVALNLERRYL